MVGRLVVQLCEHFVWFPVPGDTLLYSLSTYSISTVTTFKIPFLRVCGSVLVRSTTPTNTYRFHSMVYRICSPVLLSSSYGGPFFRHTLLQCYPAFPTSQPVRAFLVKLCHAKVLISTVDSERFATLFAIVCRPLSQWHRTVRKHLK